MSRYETIAQARKTIYEFTAARLERMVVRPEGAGEQAGALRALATLLQGEAARGTRVPDLAARARDFAEAGFAQRLVEGAARQDAALDAAEDLYRRAEWVAGTGAEHGLYNGTAAILIAGALAGIPQCAPLRADLLRQTVWALPDLDDEELHRQLVRTESMYDSIAHPISGTGEVD